MNLHYKQWAVFRKRRNEKHFYLDIWDEGEAENQSRGGKFSGNNFPVTEPPAKTHALNDSTARHGDSREFAGISCAASFLTEDQAAWLASLGSWQRSIPWPGRWRSRGFQPLIPAEFPAHEFPPCANSNSG